MSPASSGSLEVERYIGACLISSHTRQKNQQPNYYPHNNGYVSYRPRRCNSVDGWAGGMPLISFANHNLPDDPSLSRLAVHTQGLPLILAGRHANRRTKQPRNGPPNVPKKLDNVVNAVDSLSVASDESSSSINSETSLPRIIKPRKRRKKDRKPHPVRAPEEPTGSSNIVTLKPYVPYCFERFARTPKNTERIVADDTKKASVDESPQLHHRFEDVVEDADISEPSSCQCRYCDPAGQIWDVDRHCYSPFLTSPPFRQLHHSVSDPTGKQLHLSERLQTQCLISAFSVCKDKEVGRPLPNRTQQCLEISTKIVTSPNGHRDLEIRLFSSFPIDDDRPPKDNNNQVCGENNECVSSLTPEE